MLQAWRGPGTLLVVTHGSNIVALTAKANLQQDSALMEQVLKQVVDMENRGYQFEAAEASFELLVQRAAGKFKPHLELLH